ncbi:uncharacterized protein LOC120894985 [Anopheles arabiensis]|uniref:uncharacterized protein LOC120894985 n=1 Tax=Anopheles arabiensis TaxID=7173 RepID=UPI001AAD5827|nr:uncharacterized protein LOC120894985 [Anopheles arabiensis]
MNGLVEIVVFGSVLAAGFFPPEVNGEFLYNAEPSQHVMHIRKLTDSDKLRIELEPVWFHLESSDQSPSPAGQQVKRQATGELDIVRPMEIYPSVDELKRQQRKRARGSRSEPSMNDNADTFLQHFWHVETDSNGMLEQNRSPKQFSSLEQQLDEGNLPSCFRKYLHEVYDRNNRSVRKLMRCLAQQSEESCKAARRPQRYLAPHYSSSEEKDTNEEQEQEETADEDYARDRPCARKVMRRRKYAERADSSEEENASKEQLKFEQLFIRSDGDSGGAIFEPTKEEELESSRGDGTVESTSSDEPKSDGVETKPGESNESRERLYTRDGRLRPVAYRRMPQKYNTRRRKSSASSEESKQDCSGEECDNDGSWEYY